MIETPPATVIKMKKVYFEKYVASGNDFIVVDNRENLIKDKKKFVIKSCKYKTGIGADGVLFLEKSKSCSFKMRIFNSDGSEAEMCGNGARCIFHYAYYNKIAKKKDKFETLAGIISGEIISKNRVKVKLTPPRNFKENIKIEYKRKKYNIYFVDTGVPHVVIFLKEINNIDVKDVGRYIRFHKKFQPAGTNINFVKIKNKHELYIRTYERGVEGETLSCGTGSTASAFTGWKIGNLSSPVAVHTRSGETLKVYIKSEEEVYLEGNVSKIFSGSFYY